MGIKAAQVIDFLTSHSHQTVQGLANVIPPNVREQLLLWEAELDRFTAVDVSILGMIMSVMYYVFQKLKIVVFIHI